MRGVCGVAVALMLVSLVSVGLGCSRGGGSEAAASHSQSCTAGETMDSEWGWGLKNARFNKSLAMSAAGANGSARLRSISRAEVIQRAQEWADKKIPYCQCNGPEECCGDCPYCSSYRCDCSGYVSYTWALPYGYDTKTLPDVAHRIEKDELQAGDVMLNVGDHVVLFVKWANADKSAYHCFQEPGCHTSGPHYAFESIVAYPFSSSGNFLPYRYNNIVD
eukprot:ANDGO_05156.mRNA.1 hypothetical protein ACA1_391420